MFSVGDSIIISYRGFYDAKIYNGETGTIRSRYDGGHYFIDFDNPELELKTRTLAFHKSIIKPYKRKPDWIL